ncbi:MAG: hypothetical protein JXD18_11025 [Anaerolineae bacterium]|nr:hypothetical protein [Anaerolineae bacterium]
MTRNVSLWRVAAVWWPLAGSWLLMSAEQPAMSAVVARLAAPEINLAAWGGVVFPLILIIESPIIMLLSASTALSRDWDSYLRIRTFMMWAGAVLTVLHVLVAFTPVYYVVVEDILRSPAEIVEPARIGLMIMTPWTWAIAFRRFNQGVMIRFGHPRAVALGTLIRLAADIAVLVGGYLIGTIPGIVVASSAIAAGVVAEAIYAGLRVRPVIREQLRHAPAAAQPLTWRVFVDFYLPLALTSLLNLVVQPLGSAAIGRMPQALASLAVWPVVTGVIFVLRSLGVAYNEVVIALLDEPGAARQLRRFAALLVVSSTALQLLLAATPLGELWFRNISALPERLLPLATTGMWLAVLLPGLNVLQSWYQGTLTYCRRTRGITEALGIFLVVTSAVLWLGVQRGEVAGLYVGLAAFTVGSLAHTAWVWLRSRPAMRSVRDQAHS